MFGPTAQQNIEALLYPLQTEGRTREPLVESEIVALLLSTPAHYRVRMGVEDHKAPGFVQSETLVYLFRVLHRANREEAWDIVEILVKRTASTIQKKLRVWRLNPQQMDDCTQEIHHKMLLDLVNTGQGVEFWEIRFWLCLERRILSLVSKHQRTADQEFSADAPADGSETSETPLARLEDTRTLPMQTLIEMQEALSLLDADDRKAFLLFHQHRWSQQEIAAHLNVTDRTIRNRLNRAEKRLAEWRTAH